MPSAGYQPSGSGRDLYMQGPGALQPSTGFTPNAANNAVPKTTQFIEAGLGFTRLYGIGAKHPSPSMYALSGTGRDVFVLSSARTPKSMLEEEQPATQAKDICYLQSPAQRARDFARTTGGPSGLTPAQRQRLHMKQAKWVNEATGGAAERGAALRRTAAAVAAGSSGGGDSALTTMTVPCAKPIFNRSARGGAPRKMAAERRQLYRNRITGQTFFTEAEAAASTQAAHRLRARTRDTASELGHVIK